MAQRSKGEGNESIKYLTLDCARGGKVRNHTSNISKPLPTMKKDCKIKINAILVEGILRITITENDITMGSVHKRQDFLDVNELLMIM